jgi:hypothetical protein
MNQDYFTQKDINSIQVYWFENKFADSIEISTLF